MNLSRKGLSISPSATLAIDSKAKKLKAEGATLLNEEPMDGAHGKKVAFVHPKSVNGVLTELSMDGCCGACGCGTHEH